MATRHTFMRTKGFYGAVSEWEGRYPQAALVPLTAAPLASVCGRRLDP